MWLMFDGTVNIEVEEESSWDRMSLAKIVKMPEERRGSLAKKFI